MLDGDGNLVVTSGSISVKTHGGTTTFVYKAKGVPNSTGRAVIYNYENTGLLCGTALGLTKDWQNTVSASGNVTLVCKLRLK